MKARRLALPILLTLSLPALSGGTPRAERIWFPPGATSATVQGHLEGRGDRDYLLSAKAGQDLAVTLHADHPQTHFNVLPPGGAAGERGALFVGSAAGNRFDGTLPETGDYRVRVYLMGAAGRRGERATYGLEIQIGRDRHAAPPAAANPPDFADGLAGGPDFWEVRGVPPGDTLHLRAGPAPQGRVVGQLPNGTVLRNRGCRMTDGQRWCQVAPPDGSGPTGWVAGRYLRESSHQP